MSDDAIQFLQVEAELAESRRICEAATPGPFGVEAADVGDLPAWHVWTAGGIGCVALVYSGLVPDPSGLANAKFFTHARIALPAALDALDAAEANVKRLRLAWARESHELDQLLGVALGYPANPGGQEGVCTGEHTVVTLAMEAAEKIERLRAVLEGCR